MSSACAQFTTLNLKYDNYKYFSLSNINII